MPALQKNPDPVVIWSAQPRQALFISCPADDVGFGGARGGGKTDAIVGDFIAHESTYGEHAIGLAVRRHRTELVELIERSKQIATPLGYRWKDVDKSLVGPKGGRLRMAYVESDSDADLYQGHGYTRLYAEEMGTFPSETAINKLQATLRSGHGVPCQMKGTCNPGGPGHQWVKARYRLDQNPKGMEVYETEFKNPFTGELIRKRRVFIPSLVVDNRFLGADYIANLHQVGNDALVRAWLYGDWSIIAGAFFEEFSPDRHLIEPFTIPQHWVKFSACDWGSAKPFAVLWYAVSAGDVRGIARGALVQYREWYGCKKKPNGEFEPNTGIKLTAEEVARGITELERPGECSYRVIDPAAFAEDGGPSIASRMANAPYLIAWRRADNRRVARHGAIGGWDQVRDRLKGDADGAQILFFTTCRHTIRTLPALQHDAANPEDVDTDAEDHAPDAVRYACMSRPYMRPVPKALEAPTGARTIDEMVRRYEQRAAQHERI